jgi:two-component system chemotaxis response regulator CheY
MVEPSFTSEAFLQSSVSGTDVPGPFDFNQSILIVDDHQVMVDLIMRYVRKIGFTDVDHTVNGMQALRMLRDKRYGLVISDLQMEPLGGLQLLRSVRADEDLRHVRFLMATGDVEAANVTAAKKLGVDSYLLKPFTRMQLEAKLHEIL